MSGFRAMDRRTGFRWWPPPVDGWLPEKHLARFAVEGIGGRDLRAMSGGYRDSGPAPHHPGMPPGILIHDYAAGVFSSRAPERAAYDKGGVSFHRGQRSSRPRHDRGVRAAV
ncbi:MAG: IS5/IS1182 family transposase, partial [Methylocella sp.]